MGIEEKRQKMPLNSFRCFDFYKPGTEQVHDRQALEQNLI